jgi:hypothetical protein
MREASSDDRKYLLPALTPLMVGKAPRLNMVTQCRTRVALDGRNARDTQCGNTSADVA